MSRPRPGARRIVFVVAASIALLGIFTGTAVAQPASPGPGIRTASGTGSASVSQVGAWPPGTAAACHYVDIIGARGSGEPAGGEFHGLGAPVNKMISVVEAALKKYGYSYSTYAVNYPAASVTVLAPTKEEVAEFVIGAMEMMTNLGADCHGRLLAGRDGGPPGAAEAVWLRDQLYQGRVAAGRRQSGTEYEGDGIWYLAAYS